VKGAARDDTTDVKRKAAMEEAIKVGDMEVDRMSMALANNTEVGAMEANNRMNMALDASSSKAMEVEEISHRAESKSS
jgi:hypothetical protein